MRDYGMDLREELDVLSWRRFRVLLDNLNPDGAAAARIRAENEKKDKEPNSDEQSANAFFTRVMSIKSQ